MRDQLELARGIVSALARNPRCGGLTEAIAGWDEKPSSLWRKRIARHLRDCEVCESVRRPIAERLLAGFPLLVPPPALVAKVAMTHATAAIGTTTAAATLFGGVGAKVAAGVAAVALLGGGVAAVVAAQPDGGHRSQPPVAAPAPTALGSTAPVPVKPARPTPSGTAASTFRTTVPAFPRSVTVRAIGAVRQDPHVAGRDNGQSTGYGGKSVWVFDDTTLKGSAGSFSNSAATTSDLDADDGIDLPGPPAELVPLTAAEKASQSPTRHYGFWPGPVIADPARHRVLFTYGKVCDGGQVGGDCSGALGQDLGMGIGAIDMRTGKVTRLIPRNDTAADPTLFFGPTGGFGGTSALVVDEYAYFYGSCSVAGCQVARVPLADLSDLAAWRAWDGKGWNRDLTTGINLIAPGGAGQSVFYDSGLRAYVNVFLPYGSNAVMYQVGGSPFGPWSGTRELFTTDGSGGTNYALFAHPEYASSGGLVQYLSYYHPATGEQRLLRWEATRP
jgi:hypothetical protein